MEDKEKLITNEISFIKFHLCACLFKTNNHNKEKTNYQPDVGILTASGQSCT